MYRTDIRVRYSEVNAKKQVTMSQIINYFQDCSIFQSEDIGVGIDYLEEKNCAWWLASWQVEVDRYPNFGEQISIGTWAHDFKGIYGHRNFDLQDREGKQIAKANSIWIYMDLEKQRPVRITEEISKPYGLYPKLEMEYASRKIEVTEGAEEYPAFTILKGHIDTNFHVNNQKYIEFAEEFLPTNKKILQMRVDYKKAAKLNDRIVPKVLKTGDQIYIVQLCEENGSPYVIMEYKMEI